MFGGSGIAYQSLGFANSTDAVYLPVAVGSSDGRLGVPRRVQPQLDPYWSSSLFGGIGFVRYDGTAKAEFCAAFAVSHPGQRGIAAVPTYTCNPDFNVAQIGFITRWTPVKNLTFSGEVLYTRLDQKFSGFSNFSPGAPQPTQNWTFHDQETLALNVRVQRNF
jgi:hypothetical protein